MRAVVPRDEKQSVTAENIGQTQATISRWRSGKAAPDEAAPVAAFAKAYGRDVLEAFVAAGLLELEDAGRGLSKYSREYLAGLEAIPPGSEDSAYWSFRDAWASQRPRPRRPPAGKAKDERKRA